MRARSLGVAVAGTVLAGALAAPANAINIGISAAAPATFGTALAPGTTTSSTGGSVTVTSLLGLTGWTLTVKDATNAGFMQAAGVGCGGSVPALGQRLQIAVVDPGYSSVSVAAKHAVTGTDTTVATYSALVSLLSSIALTTTLEQTVGATEKLLAGCVYSTTLTYTVQ